jgi:hypothetical protein
MQKVESRVSDAAVSGPTPLAGNQLYALSYPYEVGRRVSTHPLDARGYAPMQVYLIREPDEGILVGTGLAIHESQLLADLEGLVGGIPLWLAPLRMELTALCNARSIIERYDVKGVYQRLAWPISWLDYRPQHASRDPQRLRSVEIQMIKGEPVFVGAGQRRRLEFMAPPLRLLANPWLYDEATKTLFTADSFSWVWREDNQGPWILTDGDADPTTAEHIERFLARTRFWWLPGARTDAIRAALAEVFDRLDIVTIAPDYGCVLMGRDVVQRHYRLLDEVLAAAPSKPSQCVAAGELTFASQQ